MEQVKDIVKKYGNYIVLGAFGLAFISVFLPFISASADGFSISANLMDDGAWGWIVILLALEGAAVVAIETFKRDIFDNLKNNAVELLVNYLPLGFAGLIFLITLIEGIQAKNSYTHWNIGFFFLIIAALCAGAVVVVRRFIMKDMYKCAPVAPVAPVQPVQPMPQQPMQQPPVQPQQPVQPTNPNQNQ